ncbi:MAG: adenylate/guanylate cyclase domain-containing protein, partial [Acidimicrobiia bacterium]|nr:adenylate/guanylate cyclase domain-containing protein [Acidimicrobiia bacterium]
ERVWASGLKAQLLANAVGAAIVVAYFEVTSLPSTHNKNPVGALGKWGDPALFAIYAVLIWGGGRYVSRRVFRRTTAWAFEDRPPTDNERIATLGLPRRAALSALVSWPAVGVITALLNYATHESFALSVRIAVGVSAAGVAVALVTSVLAERSLRPLFVVVLAGAPPERARVVGIRRRLLLFWAIGSGLPLLGVLLTPVGLPASDRDRILVGMLVVAGCGLVAGLGTTVVAAASVADPIADVRGAMARVAGGDLNAEVPVDDDGELGLLQAGFNTMASGLRERERLRELFGGYVGDEVARRAVESGVTLEGEERDVSVLFVDVVGSTALAERRPAVEVVALLNGFFDAVIRTVDSEQGWVNKFEGDATLCVFGAPMDQPDHAARALRSAVALRSALRAIEGLDAGIGISSGIAVAGNVGSERRYEYTVVGDPVNEAARLTELAKAHPGRIVVSEATVTAGGGSGDGWRPGECVTLRGRSRPTQTFVPA